MTSPETGREPEIDSGFASEPAPAREQPVEQERFGVSSEAAQPAAEARVAGAETISPSMVAGDGIHVSRVVVGGAVIAREQVRESVRNATGRTAAMVLELLEKTREETNRRARGVRGRLRSAIDQAERRGRDTLEGRKQSAASIVDTTVNGAVGWAQVKVVPQLVDDLVPHLVSNVVPRLIEGALPEIKARMVPALIDDMTNDPRIRELILAQSRGVLGQVTENLRTGTARADERFESAAHRVFGRNDRGGGAGGKGDDAGASGDAGGKWPDAVRGG